MNINDVDIDWSQMRAQLTAYEIKHLEELQRLHYTSIRGSAAERATAAYMACALVTIERLCGAVTEGASNAER